MSDNLYLNPHIILAKASNTNTSPNGLVIRHIFLEIAHHSIKGLIIQRQMIRINSEYFLPSLPTSVLEVMLHVGECLVDLRIDLTVDYACFAVPPPLKEKSVRRGRFSY